MPIHDWTRVDAGIFHDFHHEWISTIRRALNQGLLPADYYALAEQQAAGFGPDVLTLKNADPDDAPSTPANGGGGELLLAPPRTRFTAESSSDFFRRKKSAISVRHVSGDHLVAVIEIVSPGNKGSRSAFKSLLDKACELLEHKIHLLILDLFPPTKRDPHGIHAALWEQIADLAFDPPADKPLTLASYESGATVRAFVEPVAVGEPLPDMPLFLSPGAHVLLPLEATYQSAWEAVPRRWQAVLEGPPG
jgi:hypothetical protein